MALAAESETTIETWCSLDRIPHPEIRGFATYWQTKRAARRAPARCDIDPSELARFLPHMYMLDVVPPGPRVRMRLIGSDATMRGGFNFTGRFLDEVLPPELYTEVQLEVNDVVQEFALRYKISDLEWQDRPYARYHRLMMPLSPDQATVNMILGIGYVIDEVESPATRSAREASFLQARILIG
jgi:hypothetical protein